MITTEPAATMPRPPAPATDPARSTADIPYWRSGVVIFLGFVILVVNWLNPPLIPPPAAGVVLRLPGEVGDFIGLDSPMSQAEITILPKDTGFTRKDYKDFKGGEIIGTIVLSGAEERSIHRPEVCLVAQGWSIVSQKDIPIQLASGHQLVVRSLDISRNNVMPDNSRRQIRALYVYWFVGDNITTPSHITRVFLSSWDRAFHNRSHRWAYVSVLSLVTDNLMPNGRDQAQTETLLTNFIRGAVPTFQKTEMTDDTRY